MDQLNSVLRGRKENNFSEFTEDLRSSLQAIQPSVRKTWTLSTEQDLSENIVKGRCDNWFGWVQVPVGVAGPLMVDGETAILPLATTEGALIASICRGCKAAKEVSTVCLDDRMTRGPVFKLSSVDSPCHLQSFLRTRFEDIQSHFESCSHHCKLLSIEPYFLGRYAFLRFSATTGEAMGMNMVTFCTKAACNFILHNFEHNIQLVSISGNFCIDKKASALNIISGRGKCVIAECTVPKMIVEKVLKASVDSLVQTCISKCWYGSALSGAVGGNNAHAANIIAAAFIATGQDVAQVVESAACFTTMEKDDSGDLVVSVTMPCLEVGALGGGTGLPTQSACLQLALNGHTAESLATCFARRLCAFVLAGELSLLASLSEGSLVTAHKKLNRA